jgi:hypothetical protein
MNRKLLTLIILAVCGTGIYFWWYSDTKVITRSTEKLIGCFELEAGSSRLGGAVATSTFRDLLDDKIFLKIESKDIPYASEFSSGINKAELVQIHSGLTQSPAVITISDKKISVQHISSDQATVNLSFQISTDKLPENINISLNCDLTYKKTKDGWRVSSLVVK